MTGWLIVNSFLKTEKFEEIYRLLLNEATKRNAALEIKTAADLLCTADGGFDGLNLPDFAIFWDKDIYLAKRLENAGVRLFNNAEAVEKCDNKALTAIALERANIATPKTVIAPKTFEGVGYCDTDFIEKAVRLLGLPMIIKEVYGSFGKQVYLADSIDKATKIVKSLGFKDFIMQEYIGYRPGTDVRINIVGGTAVATMLRFNKDDFRSNITNGGSMAQFAPTDEQKELAVNACKALNLDFAGVDILFGKDDKPLICEVNSNPNFKSTLDCTGINLAEHIIDYIIRCMK